MYIPIRTRKANVHTTMIAMLYRSIFVTTVAVTVMPGVVFPMIRVFMDTMNNTDIEWKSYTLPKYSINTIDLEYSETALDVGWWIYRDYINLLGSNQMTYLFEVCDFVNEYRLQSSAIFNNKYDFIFVKILFIHTPSEVGNDWQNKFKFCYRESNDSSAAMLPRHRLNENCKDLILNNKPLDQVMGEHIEHVSKILTVSKYLYLGFESNKSCVQIIQIKMYTVVCSAYVRNLVNFLETAVSHQKSAKIIAGSCVANSEMKSYNHNAMLQNMCTHDGYWRNASAKCQCVAGHESVDNNRICRSCFPGTYKPTASDSPCKLCPHHSESTLTGASYCKCWDMYYRQPGDSPSIPCDKPMSTPRNLNIRVANEYAEYVSVLRWESPTDVGGSFTRVSYGLECDSCESDVYWSVFNGSNVINIFGLKPLKNYTLRLWA